MGDPEDGQVPSSFYGVDGATKHRRMMSLFRSYNFRRNLPCFIVLFITAGVCVSLGIAYRRGHVGGAGHYLTLGTTASNSIKPDAALMNAAQKGLQHMKS